MNKTAKLLPATPAEMNKMLRSLALGLNEAGFSRDLFQSVIKAQGTSLLDEIVAVFRRRVEEASNTIVKTVLVNRKLGPKEVLKTLPCEQSTTESVVINMPRAKSDWVEIVFFKVNKLMSNDEEDQEYGRRGLKPADPCSLITFNKECPEFADDKPNGASWIDANGDRCYIAFARHADKRYVYIHRRKQVRCDFYWLAGIRK